VSVALTRVAFWATALFAAASFWFAPRPPMADLPQHAGQVALLHSLLAGEATWRPLVYVNWFTPYFAGYGPALLLSWLMPVLAALKLLLALAYLGFVAAHVALRRALAADPRLDWLVLPSFFGIAYAAGLYTFLLAAPLGVLFILLALRHARAPTLATGTLLLAADLVLFFAHGLVFLFANVIGGLFLLLKARPIARLVVTAAPYLGVGVLVLAYSLARLRFETVPADDPWSFFWGWDALRLSLPTLWAGWSTEDPHDLLFAVLFAVLLAAPLVLKSAVGRGEALVPFLVVALVWLVVPLRAQGTGLIYLRFALFVLPFYALLFRPRPTMPGGARVLVLPLACWVFLAAHTDRLLAFARESAPFEQVLAAARPGERALAAVFDPTSVTGAEFAYIHWPSWYQAERGGFVDFNFGRFLPQIVRYRPDRLPARFGREDWAQNPGQGFDWERDGAAAYRYFFVRHMGPLPQAFFPAGQCRPVLVRAAGDWSLFENVRCRAADAPKGELPPTAGTR
jgi:hypothetical protein